MSDRYVVRATQVKDVCDVVVTKLVIALDPEAGQSGRAITIIRFVEQVGCIGAALRPGVISKRSQPVVSPVLICNLQGVIEAVSFEMCVVVVTREIREGRVGLTVGGG